MLKNTCKKIIFQKMLKWNKLSKKLLMCHWYYKEGHHPKMLDFFRFIGADSPPSFEHPWSRCRGVSRGAKQLCYARAPKKYQRWRGQSLQGSSKFHRHHNTQFVHKHFHTHVQINKYTIVINKSRKLCLQLTFGHSLIQWYHMNK